jgi:hypothetical protein
VSAMLLHAAVVSLLGPALAWPLRRALRARDLHAVGAWCALTAGVWAAVLVPSGLTHVLLLLAAVAFWTVAFGLDDARRALLLLAAAPAMDLTAAILPPAQAAVMLAGSLPLGAVAVVAGWRWLAREEAYAA